MDSDCEIKRSKEITTATTSTAIVIPIELKERSSKKKAQDDEIDTTNDRSRCTHIFLAF